MYIFSITEKLQDDLNFRDTIKNIVNDIRLWHEKTLAISKFAYLALLTTIPNSVFQEYKQIHKI